MTDMHDAFDGEPARSFERPLLAASDSVPAFMSSADRRILVEERERLLALFESDERASGGSAGRMPYGFVTREEFWVELVETFMSGRLGKAIIREASPRLYELLRAFLGRTDLPPSGIARG